jgi:hypothetical protein
VGTPDFLRSRYSVFWFGILLLLVAAIGWLAYQAPQSGVLGPVPASEVKTTAVESADTAAATLKSPLEPAKAFLEEAQFSLTSDDGKTQMRITARQAAKEGDSYSLKLGTIEFLQGADKQLRLSITDATYDERNGVAYVVGSMRGELPHTGHRFTAEKLRWDEATNSVAADAIHYEGDRIDVRGDQMTIQLPGGVVEFTGPVTAEVSGGLDR